MDEFDLAIVGYGPTGQALASLAARLGLRVCVFERWPTLFAQPRIATIDAESARIIQASSPIDAALRHSVPRDRYIFANAAGEILIDHGWSGAHACGFPMRISLHQPDIETAMDAAARARGAEVNQGWEVRELSQDASGVTVTAQARDDGAERRIRARYVVGADGARSTVRTLLGIGRDPWPFRNAWYTVDALRRRELPNLFGISPDGQNAVIFCVPEGRAHSVIPLGVNHIRFNFECDPDADHSEKMTNAYGMARVREVYGLTADDIEVYRQAIFPFEGQMAHSWRVGRVFLAGDAAHLMTPFLGQGGTSGFRDAVNLAWKLHLVITGVAPEALLDSYETERRPHVHTYIEGSDRLAALAFIADPVEAAARDRAFLAAGKPPPSVDLPLDAGLLHRAPDGGIALPVGGLGPQGVVRGGGREGRFDDVVGWGFQLLMMGADPLSCLDDGQAAFLRRIGAVSANIGAGDGAWLDRDGAYARWFGEFDIRGVLVRPDFVVFGVIREPGDVAIVVDDLRAQLGA